MLFSFGFDGEQNTNGKKLTSLFEKSYQKVYKTALAITSDAEMAKDAVQEAFLKAFQKIGTLKDKGKFDVWVCSIVSNICKDMLIRRNRQRDKNLTLYDSDDNVKYDIKNVNDRDIPETALENKELIQELNKSISELSLDDQQIIFLRFRHDFSYEEISEYMRLKKGTVKSKVHRAKGKIYKKLKNYINGKGKKNSQ